MNSFSGPNPGHKSSRARCLRTVEHRFVASGENSDPGFTPPAESASPVRLVKEKEEVTEATHQHYCVVCKGYRTFDGPAQYCYGCVCPKCWMGLTTIQDEEYAAKFPAWSWWRAEVDRMLRQRNVDKAPVWHYYRAWLLKVPPGDAADLAIRQSAQYGRKPE
jgi:hypothetical protein